VIFLPQSSVQVLKLPVVNGNCVTKPLSGCEVYRDIESLDSQYFNEINWKDFDF
jgi:hypothetical protein